MRKLRIRRQASLDLDHMRMLHHEAIEQLELMRTAIEAAEQANDGMRDSLDEIALNHWHAYMDIIHMVCMHDQGMSSSMKRYGLKMRDNEPESEERQSGFQRMLILLLLLALLRRHRRMEYVFGLRGGPMNDYLQESCNMEREHIAELVSMIHNMF